MPSTIKGLPLQSLGSGVSVVVCFEKKWAHVFGRQTFTPGQGLLGKDQIILRTYTYPECESVRVSRVDGVGCLVTLTITGKGGLLQQAVAGGDVVLAMSNEALDSQQPQIEKLQKRINQEGLEQD